MSAKQHMIKLIASLVMAMFALAVMVGGTYAWFVLSTEPEVRGMRVSVGGKNTIQVAQDLTEMVGGSLSHIPGSFGSSVSLDGDGLGELSPVSTADGVHWMLPHFKTLEEGGEMDGFTAETDLLHANLSGGEPNGTYAYLDFWVISPEHCLLRLATEYVREGTSPSGVYQAGSFAVAIPSVSQSEGEFIVGDGHPAAEACLRIGFLVDDSQAPDAVFMAYRNRPGSESKAQRLLGLYPERGVEASAGWEPRFTIYEPNADLHPAEPDDHSVWITQPVDASSNAVSVADRLTAQLRSGWRVDLTQKLRDNIAGKSISTVEQAQSFMNTECAGQFSGWLKSGNFVSRTEELYSSAAQNGGAVPEEVLLASGFTAGATEDVYIAELQANVPQRIRMFLWLEGADGDCVGASGPSDFCVHLELAGDTTLVGLEP